ncbi:MAG: tol-pal system protein YbgF [Proteobacteria bacterium]|nr:tol-pal system protein YbgF [Pseudomonadota bacterium]
MRLNKSNCTYLIAPFLLGLLLPGCIVPNKELIQVQSDVELLKQGQAQLREANKTMGSNLESKLNFVKTGTETSRKGTQKSVADTSARVDTLQADFQRLSGRFEELKYGAEKSSTQNNVFLETAEERMTAAETKTSELEAQLAELKLTVTTLIDERKQQEEAKESAKDIYKAGLDAINDKKTKEGREKFKQYLNEAPDGPLANNAQFWIGESYYDEGNYERAILEYDEVLKKYPDGGKVPAAMLKQAMAFEKIRSIKTSQALFQKLVKKFPGSDEAKVAKKKLKTKKKAKKKVKKKVEKK